LQFVSFSFLAFSQQAHLAMPVMIRISFFAGLLVSVSAISAWFQNQPSEQLRHKITSEAKDRHATVFDSEGNMRLVQSSQQKKSLVRKGFKSSLESWGAKHPQLPAPYFWFWGRIAEVVPGSNLIQKGKPVLQSPSAEPQNLVTPNKDSYSQWGQDKILRPILSKVGKGFFVESGAKDGESDSNTLSYELEDGWTGLLIEPDPTAFNAIAPKHRHAYVFNGCLSPNGRAETLRFHADNGNGQSHISDTDSYTVQSQSLQALMEAIGRTTVDFWSLDIEGSESAVLHSTDFSQVEVGVLLVEMNKNEANNDGIREVMQREGFQDIGHSNYQEGGSVLVLDHIFVNPKYFLKRGLAVPVAEDLDDKFRN